MYVEGVVVGLIPSHTGSGSSLGVYVSDGNKVAPVEFGGELAINGKYSAVIGETEVKVGTGIKFSKIKVNDKKLVASDKTTCTITGNVDVSGNWLHPAEDSVTTINNATEMAEYVGKFNDFGTSSQRDYSIVKVVATEENPIYIGARNAYFMMFSYLSADTLTSTSNDAFAYIAGDNSTKSWIGSHTGAARYTIGEQWLLDNTPYTALNGDDYSGNWKYEALKDAANGASTYKFTGSFYMIFEYMGSAKYPYVYCGILGASFNLTRVVEEAA